MNKNIYKATTDQTSGEPMKNKFLDYEGVKHLWSKINMNDYPNNQILIDVINAIDETKANKEDIVPADWNAAEDEPGHVLNRPFYSEYETKTLLEETTFTVSEEEGMEAIIPHVVDLTGISKVEVTYNGTKYVCPVTIDDSEGMVTFEFGDRSLMGDDIESTGEPFVAMFFDATSAGVAGVPGAIMPLDGSTTFTVSIAEITEIVHKIPDKFLPTSDWNASEGESGHISNRPFYSEFTESVILPECNIEYDEDGSVINISEIPLFNLIPGNEYTVNWNGVHYKCTAAAMDIDGITVAFVGDIGFVETGTSTTGEPFIIGTMSGQMELAPLDGSTSVAISIAELTKVVHKLDNKYLDLDWFPIIEKGVVLLEKTVVESNKLAVVEFAHAGTLGQVVHVEYDSVRYECTIAEVEGHAVIGNQSFISGDLQNSGEPFILVVQSDTRLFCVFADGGSHEIAIYDFAQEGEIYNRIPDGFLPAHIAEGKRLAENALSIAEDAKKGLENKSNRQSPELSGSLSLNRKSGTIGTASSTLGDNCAATTYCSHAEGYSTTASGEYSHAEGYSTTASGMMSHAEGYSTTASGSDSHAEGADTLASGYQSHAEGRDTVASGNCSHAQGFGTTANRRSQYVCGEYNVADVEGDINLRGAYAHIVGNGGSDTNRSNAHTLDWDGNAWYAGDIRVGGTSYDDGSEVALKSDIENIDLSGYETISNAQLKLDEAKEYTDTKTSGMTTTTVVDNKISAHNTSTSAHNDIRDLINGLTTRLNTLANSDDTTLDQMSEVVAYIKNNKSLIDGITTSKVNVADIINNLTTNATNKPLSAAQGVAIKALIDTLQSELDSHTHTIVDVSGLQSALDGKANADHNHKTLTFTGAVTSTYDGSSDKTINIVGKAGTGTKAEMFNDASEASGTYSHAEGYSTTASGNCSHAEGYNTMASGDQSHTEGSNTTASGNYSHAEGNNTIASGNYSHSEGISAKAFASGSHAEGSNTKAFGNYSHSEGKGTNWSITITGDANATTYTCINNGSGKPIIIGYILEYNDIYATITNVDDNNITVDKTLSSTALSEQEVLLIKGIASGYCSHVEGEDSVALGKSSHAEGYNTMASGDNSHAEGNFTIASGFSSHAEGNNTIASGNYSHVQGKYNKVDTNNKYAHIVGNGDANNLSNAHTLDWGGNAWYKGNIRIGGTSYNDGSEVALKTNIIGKAGTGTNSEMFNAASEASGNYSHAEGYYTTASGENSHAEGNRTTASGNYSHAEGQNTTASGLSSHAEGYGYNKIPDTITSASTNEEIIEAWKTTKFMLASGDRSHAEGSNTIASGFVSHAEGRDTIASGRYSHAEGSTTTASGSQSHAEGENTTASGDHSHAEGRDTTASKYASHAEGWNTTASGDHSHAEGFNTAASGQSSHAEGSGTTASGEDSHVQGRYNIEDTADKYAHIVGNGTYDLNRSNAHTLDWDGNAWYAGDVYVGSTSGTNRDESSKKLATEEYVNTIEAKIPTTPEAVGADPTGSALESLVEAKSYADTAVAALVNSAPETLDTLGELATAFEENADMVATLNAAITNKAEKSDLDNLAELVDLNATNIESLQAQVLPTSLILADAITGKSYTIQIQNGQLVSFETPVQ